jgi:hypothetical protein
MNRKLHNTVTALAATTGLLVLGLMAASPAMVPMPQAPTETVVQARHAAEAAKRIEARAARLESRLAKAATQGEAIGEIAGFAAEAATLAVIATAFDEANAFTTQSAPPAVVPPRKRAGGRQSVAMPFFSFAPRG